MGFLTDFAGAFASNIGGELKQREDQDYQLKLQKLLSVVGASISRKTSCVGARWATRTARRR